MNEEEFEECSVVAYPHEIRFLHIKGGRISYCVDRHISDYVNKIQQENQELKKQLEKKYEKLGTLTTEILYEENTRLVNEITVLKTENQKLKEMQCIFLGTGCQNKIKEYKIQQREFIDWLENEIENCKYGEENYADGDDMSYHNENELRKEILLKYKEIIGGKNK